MRNSLKITGSTRQRGWTSSHTWCWSAVISKSSLGSTMSSEWGAHPQQRPGIFCQVLVLSQDPPGVLFSPQQIRLSIPNSQNWTRNAKIRNCTTSVLMKGFHLWNYLGFGTMEGGVLSWWSLCHWKILKAKPFWPQASQVKTKAEAIIQAISVFRGLGFWEIWKWFILRVCVCKQVSACLWLHAHVCTLMFAPLQMKARRGHHAPQSWKCRCLGTPSLYECWASNSGCSASTLNYWSICPDHFKNFRIYFSKARCPKVCGNPISYKRIIEFNMWRWTKKTTERRHVT